MSSQLSERSVGVVERDDDLIQPGYALLCAGRETYLIDEDGRRVHEWRSTRQVFVAYLLSNGNLLRDGSDNDDADLFRLGGAAGFLEVVTWNNEPVWSFSQLPLNTYLSHHDLEPMPNGNVLATVWHRRSKESAVKHGRRPDLCVDGEVWDNVVIEIKPDGKGGANIVWSWSFFHHVVQDVDGSLPNFGSVKDRPDLMDINFCPAGGKNGIRNLDTLQNDALKRSRDARVTSGASAYEDKSGKTGEKDWLHCNSVSYCPKRNHIMININVLCEFVVIKRDTVSKQHWQGNLQFPYRPIDTDNAEYPASFQYRDQPGIQWRWGNPQTYRCGSRMAQTLFAQHYAHFIEEGLPGAGNVLVFNNGRAPDRLWSTVDEITPPEDTPFSGVYKREPGKAFGPKEACWSYGARTGRKDSFFCTHISSAHRLPNGNTFITMGPQGIMSEVTREGKEVWRYISPVCNDPNSLAVTRQGDSRTGGRFSLFMSRKYAKDFAGLQGKDLTPGRHLEG